MVGSTILWFRVRSGTVGSNKNFTFRLRTTEHSVLFYERLSFVLLAWKWAFLRSIVRSGNRFSEVHWL